MCIFHSWVQRILSHSISLSRLLEPLNFRKICFLFPVWLIIFIVLELNKFGKLKYEWISNRQLCLQIIRTTWSHWRSFPWSCHFLVQQVSWTESLSNRTERNLNEDKITSDGPWDFVSASLRQLLSEENVWCEWEYFFSHVIIWDWDIFIIWEKNWLRFNKKWCEIK